MVNNIMESINQQQNNIDELRKELNRSRKITALINGNFKVKSKSGRSNERYLVVYKYIGISDGITIENCINVGIFKNRDDANAAKDMIHSRMINIYCPGVFSADIIPIKSYDDCVTENDIKTRLKKVIPYFEL